MKSRFQNQLFLFLGIICHISFCSAQVTTNCHSSYTVYTNSSGIANIQNDSLLDNGSTGTGALSFYVSQDSFSCAEMPGMAVTLTVTDQFPSTGTCSVMIEVIDSLEPVLNCPSTQILNTDPGMCSAIHTYSVTSSDNCPNEVSMLVSGLTSGSAFPKGTNSVTYLASDMSGNSTSCEFYVLVNDNEKPSFSYCPSIVAVSNDPGECKALVTYVNPVAQDNCTNMNFTFMFGAPSGSNVNVGSTVTCHRYTDESGNYRECLFNVVVNDNEPPEAVCQNITIQLDESGYALISASQIDDGSTDNCMLIGTLVDSTVFNCNHIGMNNVKLTALDNSSNKSTCSAIVTIVDNMSPSITCPTSIMQGADAGSCTAYVSIDTLNIVLDNCSSTITYNTYNYSNNISDIYPVGFTTVKLITSDIYNNTASCDFTIEVLDNEKPLIEYCFDNEVISIASSETEAYVVLDQPFVDDCSSVSYMNNYNGSSDATDTYPLGTNIVNWIVFDANGNTSSCNMEIRVEHCLPDVFEPNNVHSASSLLPSDGINGDAFICDEEVDWYYFNSGSYNNFKISLMCLNNDFDLELYDDLNNIIISSSNPGRGDEHIILNGANLGQDYHIKVFGATAADFSSNIGYCLHKTQMNSPFFQEGHVIEIIKPVSIFPNPSAGTFNIKFVSENQDEVKIELLDILGKNIIYDNFECYKGDNLHSLNLSEFQKGTYILRMEFKNENSVVYKKIIKVD